MAEKTEPQKVKVVGLLWTTRNALAIIRDLLLIVLVLLLIVGSIMLIAALPSFLQGMQSLTALPNLMQNMPSSPDALLQQLQEDVNQGNWDAALSKVQLLKSLVPTQELSAQDAQNLQNLEQALQNKNKVQFDQVMRQIENTIQTGDEKR